MQFEEKDLKLTPVSELGEFGLIEKITSGFDSSGCLITGPGDDCAVYDVGGNEFLLVTTDILAEGVHFDLSYYPLSHLGYKAVVVNLSDVFAMNGTPAGITVSIAMSSRFSVEAVEELYSGIRAACKKYGVDLLGGDTSSSKSGLVISVTAIGKVAKERLSLRSGANLSDLICVTGDLGAAYAGLQILEREKNIFLSNPEVQPDLSGFEYCVGRQLKPECRPALLKVLLDRGVRITSMMDISDGLSSDLHHICRHSKVGALLHQNKIPVDTETGRIADSFKISPMTYAMNGGEDYELLFTIPVADFEKVKDIREVSVIGHIQDQSSGVVMVTSSGQLIDLPASGYNHFHK